MAADWSCGCTLSYRTRGDTTDPHGTLQRLLERAFLRLDQSSTALFPEWVQPIAHRYAGRLSVRLRKRTRSEKGFTHTAIAYCSRANGASAYPAIRRMRPTRPVLRNP